MTELIALDMPGGTAFVDALRRIWARGDAALPLDQRLPPPARERVLDALAPSSVIDRLGDEHHRHGGIPLESDDALVIATSGTTGEPRGVIHTHASVLASAEATCSRLNATADDHWLACLPLSHVGGLSVVTRALHSGAKLTVHERFDAEAVERAARAGATLVSLVPTALARIDASLFRWVVLGGSHAPAIRPSNVVETYGMTETGSGVVYDGIPLAGVDLRLDPDGEIEVRGPMLLRCYRDGEDPKDAEGWMPTGDVGAWLPNGRLHVEGRRGDLIVTGGENVWPDAVEVVLGRHPSVAEAAIAGVPDPEWGEIVTAWVVVRPGCSPPTLAELRDHVRAELPAFTAPRALHIVAGLPRTPLGKIRRAALRRGDTASAE